MWRARESAASAARLHPAPTSHVEDQVPLAVQVQLAERRVGTVSRIEGYSSVRRGTVHLKAQLVQMNLTSGLLASAQSVFGRAKGLFSEGGRAVSTCVRTCVEGWYECADLRADLPTQRLGSLGDSGVGVRDKVGLQGASLRVARTCLAMRVSTARDRAAVRACVPCWPA
jgi:hypothetical protein